MNCDAHGRPYKTVLRQATESIFELTNQPFDITDTAEITSSLASLFKGKNKVDQSLSSFDCKCNVCFTQIRGKYTIKPENLEESGDFGFEGKGFY